MTKKVEFCLQKNRRRRRLKDDSSTPSNKKKIVMLHPVFELHILQNIDIVFQYMKFN